MIKQLIAEIYWNEIRKNENYLYGSQIKFQEDLVNFYNLRFASGKPIVTFKSRTNYQGDRHSPDLPILTQGKRYQLEFLIDSVPELSFFLQLDFFNRQTEQIESIVLRKSGESFIFPRDTFTYTLTLMSAGCQSVAYHKIMMYEINEEEEKESEFRTFENRYLRELLPKDLDLVKDLVKYI